MALEHFQLFAVFQANNVVRCHGLFDRYSGNQFCGGLSLFHRLYEFGK